MDKLEPAPVAARRRLKAIAEILLDPGAIPAEARAAAHGLTDLFAGQGGFDHSQAGQTGAQDTHTAHGKAINAVNAARCAWEYPRTAKFLQGVRAALAEAKRRFPGRRIEVLYAGTGPYATLVLPLLPFLSPAEAGFTFLDLHRHCLDSVRHLLGAFGYLDFALGFVEEDATAYRQPQGRPLHLVISETMLNALQKEPQVAISLNLAPQLAPGGLLVPARIEVSACLADARREIVLHDEAGQPHARRRVELGKLLELSLDTVDGLAAGFPKIRIDIPRTKPPETKSFLLLTRIVTFGDIALGDYECSLNCPLPLRELHDPPPGSAWEFQYRLGARPGFAHRPIAGQPV
jgi:hypothetical protein